MFQIAGRFPRSSTRSYVAGLDASCYSAEVREACVRVGSVCKAANGGKYLTTDQWKTILWYAADWKVLLANPVLTDRKCWINLSLGARDVPEDRDYKVRLPGPLNALPSPEGGANQSLLDSSHDYPYQMPESDVKRYFRNKISSDWEFHEFKWNSLTTGRDGYNITCTVKNDAGENICSPIVKVNGKGRLMMAVGSCGTGTCAHSMAAAQNFSITHAVAEGTPISSLPARTQKVCNQRTSIPKCMHKLRELLTANKIVKLKDHVGHPASDVLYYTGNVYSLHGGTSQSLPGALQMSLTGQSSGNLGKNVKIGDSFVGYNSWQCGSFRHCTKGICVPRDSHTHNKMCSHGQMDVQPCGARVYHLYPTGEETGVEPDEVCTWRAIACISRPGQLEYVRKPSVEDPYSDLTDSDMCPLDNSSGADTELPTMDRSPQSQMYQRSGPPLVPKEDSQEDVTSAGDDSDFAACPQPQGTAKGKRRKEARHPNPPLGIVPDIGSTSGACVLRCVATAMSSSDDETSSEDECEGFIVMKAPQLLDLDNVAYGAWPGHNHNRILYKANMKVEADLLQMFQNDKNLKPHAAMKMLLPRAPGKPAPDVSAL